MATFSKYEFTGTFFDGISPNKTEVVVGFTPERLILNFPDNRRRSWNYSDIRLTHFGSKNETIRLDYKSSSGPNYGHPSLLIHDKEFLNKAYEAAPGALVSFWKRPKNRPFRVIVIVLALLAIPPFLFGLWNYGLPKVTETIAQKVPPEWEQKLGDTVYQAMFPKPVEEPSPQVQAALDQIEERLLSTLPDQPYDFRIYIQPSKTVNAMALPGGTIVVFQGLIDLTESPEELAGVLSHEFQHVLLRHSTRGIIRQFIAGALLAIVVGDTNGVMDTIMGAANQLETLNYNRKMESEADREGMKMILAAQIDPEGMIGIFEKFGQKEKELLGQNDTGQENKKTGEDELQWKEFLSTHPESRNRLVHLKRLSRKTPSKKSPLLPNFDWEVMHSPPKKEESS